MVRRATIASVLGGLVIACAVAPGDPELDVPDADCERPARSPVIPDAASDVTLDSTEPPRFVTWAYEEGSENGGPVAGWVLHEVRIASPAEMRSMWIRKAADAVTNGRPPRPPPSSILPQCETAADCRAGPCTHPIWCEPLDDGDAEARANACTCVEGRCGAPLPDGRIAVNPAPLWNGCVR